MVLKRTIIAGLFLVLIGLTGCKTGKLNIHLLTPDDIRTLPQGTQCLIPKDTVLKDDKNKVIKKWDEDEKFIINKEGRFFSNYAIEEVMRARIDK